MHSVNKYENAKIFLPNEIFQDLTCIDKSTHRAFAYAYYYYTCYLYRYALFTQPDDSKITQKDIKQKLGYSPVEKRIDYIIKKGGVLDTINYTSTTTDYPLMYVWNGVKEEPEFIMSSEYKNECKNDYKNNSKGLEINNRNYKVKFPVKAFFRQPEDEQRQIYNGTFVEISNTHGISYSVFEKIMANPNLECIGLYLYGFLRHKCSPFGKTGYQRSSGKIGEELGLSKRTTIKYLKELEDGGYIYVNHKPFVLDSKEEDREANIYRVLI